MAYNPKSKENLQPPWQPGESPNPGGKYKGPTFSKVLRERLLMKKPPPPKNQLEEIVDATIAKGKKGDSFIVNTIADRQEGKVKDTVKIEDERTRMPGVPDAALAQRLANKGKQQLPGKRGRSK